MMKSFVLLLLSLPVLIQPAYALPNTWLGGNGYWEDASNWSLGTVPTLADDVEIFSGGVKVTTLNAQARSVVLSPDTELMIPKSARLLVRGGAPTGLWAAGDVYVNGMLIVEQINSGYGINVQQSGSFIVGKPGNVNIRDISSTGFRNIGTLINRGYIFIQDINSNGILNYGMLENLGGEISIINTSGIAIYGYPGVNSNGGSMINEGEINLRGTGGIYIPNGATAVNEAGAEINISYIDGSFTISENAEFNNFGRVNIWRSVVNIPGAIDGLNNRGECYNHEQGEIIVDEVNIGVYNYLTGEFHNEGVLDLDGAFDDSSIKNRGDFSNGTCGLIRLSERIFNDPSAGITNKGWVYNYSTTNTNNFGSIDNYGVIEDNPETLYPFITNGELVARPITGTVQEGIPVSNALELGGLSLHDVLGWYTSINTNTSAGIYDANTNQWTPNTAAVGLNQVYVKIRNLSEGCDEIFEVEIPGGVQPFSSLDEEAFAGQHGVEQQSLEGFQLYPNPSNGRFHISLVAGKEVQHISVFDASGKMVLEQSSGAYGGHNVSIDLTDYATGLYWVRVFDNEGAVEQQAVVVGR
jgi:hypothetical protein